MVLHCLAFEPESLQELVGYSRQEASAIADGEPQYVKRDGRGVVRFK
jgi:hypothetical protein